MNQTEPYQSIMLYVRDIIQNTLPEVQEKYNYGIPFYHYKGKPFIYLNILKRTNFVDVAFVKGVLMKDQFPQLKDYNNRKNVRSMQYTSIESINQQELSKIINTAAKTY
ncbi:DUF1801 domain-containing protein [Seonamhaeicola maritimus]|uniref:DUF1801 domain-containing protein n=1 Tax=Seonamhaeicola maritimus TaxID=2591822 RepID=A0A5C7GKX3_9FLAO|nr:DUF1801 domain-containing protein [Seonamhaeicola maritimus]TXG38767.1 DUF1801 domain-containing protein [Seonamhaeicola maritimus]